MLLKILIIQWDRTPDFAVFNQVTQKFTTLSVENSIPKRHIIDGLWKSMHYYLAVKRRIVFIRFEQDPKNFNKISPIWTWVDQFDQFYTSLYKLKQLPFHELQWLEKCWKKLRNANTKKRYSMLRLTFFSAVEWMAKLVLGTNKSLVFLIYNFFIDKIYQANKWMRY